ncbi:acylphosphatase-2-like isoform X2 [Brachionichthys hirsutus]|uniref:acylphosphatase-2-like isoform X2 n=1 Tax=Brachionichthys hirsutus TaxID=412623 RepID=UPI0036052225
MCDPAGPGLLSVDFEVFGRVQGVCFRMYTEDKGLRLGLVGWVKNTSGGTVVGQVQGPAATVEEILSFSMMVMRMRRRRRRLNLTLVSSTGRSG